MRQALSSVMQALIETNALRKIEALWSAVALLLLSLAAVLVSLRQRFDWALDLSQIPTLQLMAGLMAAGLTFVAVARLLHTYHRTKVANDHRILGGIIVVGLILRLMMFATEPALEDDQQRYLWEGALVAHGISPYRVSPKDAKAADRATALGQLADQAGPVLERINHADLRSIYPPIAEAAFALAYRIKPFSLTAWRAVLLAADCGTLYLLLLLLQSAGRSAPWVALYWWNPVVIKEIFNSGHMEGVLMLFVVMAVYFAARRRFIAACCAVALAAGVKIWPLLLVPLIVRPLSGRLAILLCALGVVAGLCALWIWPIYLGGFDERSGFVAFVERWQANGALLPALRGLINQFVGVFGGGYQLAGRIARICLGSIAVITTLWISRRPIEDASDLLSRASLVTLIIVLASPAQFPWYAIWTFAFLPFAPRWGVLAMAVLLPIYYASFYFTAIDAFAIFRDRVVWIIWIPIWTLLALEVWRNRVQEQHAATKTGSH